MTRILGATALAGILLCALATQADELKAEAKKPDTAPKAKAVEPGTAAGPTLSVQPTASTASEKRRGWVPWKRSRTELTDAQAPAEPSFAPRAPLGSAMVVGAPPVAPSQRPPGIVRPSIPASGIPATNQVVVDLRIYRVRGEISGEASFADNPSAEQNKRQTEAMPGSFSSLSVFTKADLMVAGVQFRADERGWTWNGQPTPPSGSRIEILASPKVILVPGNSFMVGIDPQQPVNKIVLLP